MREINYEVLEEKIKEGMEAHRRRAVYIFGAVSTFLLAVFIMMGWGIVADGGGASDVMIALTVGAVIAVFMNSFGWLALSGAFNQSIRQQVIRDELGMTVLDVLAAQHADQEKAKRSLEDLDEDVIIAEDGEIMRRSLQS